MTFINRWLKGRYGPLCRWIVALLLVLSYPASAAFWRHSKVLRLIFGILTIVPFFWGMLALRALCR